MSEQHHGHHAHDAALLERLRRIERQARGVEKMVGDDRRELLEPVHRFARTR